jgi:multidrug resistance efflux pump
MDLLAELLESHIHPRLALDQAKAHAKAIRASAKQLRAAVDTLAAPNERVELLQRVRRALASVAQADLTSLKRLYKNEHFSQADIHGVIPDRPASAGRSKAAPVGPSMPGGPGAPTAS